MFLLSFCFFFNDTATTEIYTLSLHDALPIFSIDRAWPILLHELIHSVQAESGWEGVFGRRSKSIMAEIDRKIKLGAKTWKQAEQKAKGAGTSDADLREETITHWLASQANSKMPLWKRIANSIRAFLFKTGIKRRATDADILGLAEDAVLRRARRGAEGATKLEPSRPLFSKQPAEPPILKSVRDPEKRSAAYLEDLLKGKQPKEPEIVKAEVASIPDLKKIPIQIGRAHV